VSIDLRCSWHPNIAHRQAKVAKRGQHEFIHTSAFRITSEDPRSCISTKRNAPSSPAANMHRRRMTSATQGSVLQRQKPTGRTYSSRRFKQSAVRRLDILQSRKPRRVRNSRLATHLLPCSTYFKKTCNQQHQVGFQVQIIIYSNSEG
jgi:hypothetical protein